MGDKKIRGKAPATGNYGSFRMVELGVLEIPAPGRRSLAVKPIREGWEPMNLKAIVLRLLR